MMWTKNPAQICASTASCRSASALQANAKPAAAIGAPADDFGHRSRQTGSRRGAMLVLVIFFIFLAGAMAALASAHFLQLARTTRQHHQSIVLRQMADSAYGWLIAQPDWRTAVPAELDMKGLLANDTFGTIHIRAHEKQPDVVVIEARITAANRHRTRTTSIKMPS